MSNQRNEFSNDLMLSGHSWAELCLKSSLRNLLNLSRNRISERRVDDDLDVLDRPDDVRQSEERSLADGRRRQSVARNDDVVRICFDKFY